MSLNHLLHALSASLNLIIICITGTKFRTTLVKLIRPRANNEVDELEKKITNEKEEKHKLEAKNVTFEDKCDDIQCISPTLVQ